MDVWGDDDDDDSGGERQTAARDTRNLRQKHYNVGDRFGYDKIFVDCYYYHRKVTRKV